MDRCLLEKWSGGVWTGVIWFRIGSIREMNKAPFGMLCRVAHLRPDVSEERVASIMTVSRIDKLVIEKAVTSN
jgi:hypothetical protein